jgi:hypothetical protein
MGGPAARRSTGRKPARLTRTSIERAVMSRTDAMKASRRLLATPFSKLSVVQLLARSPAAIETPETEEMRSMRERTPSSLRRRIAPAWKRVAR